MHILQVPLAGKVTLKTRPVTSRPMLSALQTRPTPWPLLVAAGTSRLWRPSSRIPVRSAFVFCSTLCGCSSLCWLHLSGCFMCMHGHMHACTYTNAHVHTHTHTRTLCCCSQCWTRVVTSSKDSNWATRFHSGSRSTLGRNVAISGRGEKAGRETHKPILMKIKWLKNLAPFYFVY